ncbi:hypothetical protein N8569_00945, partial [bacterium]|nr:hypothetical protein [bacterium]
MIDVSRSLEMMASPVWCKPLSPDFVIITADVFNISVTRLLGRALDREMTRARHAGMWAVREYGYSFPQSGRIFRRDPTSCIHG